MCIISFVFLIGISYSSSCSCLILMKKMKESFNSQFHNCTVSIHPFIIVNKVIYLCNKFISVIRTLPYLAYECNKFIVNILRLLIYVTVCIPAHAYLAYMHKHNICIRYIRVLKPCHNVPLA